VEERVAGLGHDLEEYLVFSLMMTKGIPSRLCTNR
jgi:hypothetical protein